MDHPLRLCTICARAGSKGVKNKNLRPLLGKPLIAHSIEQARQAKLFDGLAVSSDSEAILEMAKGHGVEWLVRRPDDLARDDSPKLPVIQHCVRQAEECSGRQFDTLVDLDASAPLRTAADIAGVVQLLESTHAANVITGVKARRSPYFNLVELAEDGTVRLAKPLAKPIGRRQDAPPCFDMNASIYAWRRSGLMDSAAVIQPTTLLFEMSESTAFDIDSELDFEFVEWLMKKGFPACEPRPVPS